MSTVCNLHSSTALAMRTGVSSRAKRQFSFSADYKCNAHMGNELKLARFSLRIYAISVHYPYEPNAKVDSTSYKVTVVSGAFSEPTDALS